MTNTRALMSLFVTASLVIGCGGSSGKSSNDGSAGATGGSGGIGGSGGAGTTGTADGSAGATPDAGGGDTVSNTDVGAGTDAATGHPGTFVASTFDVFTTQGALYLACGPDGTCYGNRTNIYKLPPNGEMYGVVGSLANGLLTTMPSSLLLDPAGNLYTSPCSGTPGVSKLPAGATTWIPWGTGLTKDNPTSCNWNTMAIDAAGNLYIGFAVIKELWKLPVGTTTWVNSGADLNAVVYDVETVGNDVYAATRNGVLVLKAGATTWVAVGTGNDGPSQSIEIDSAGNIYVININGMMKLPKDATAWVELTGVSPKSNLVFDSANNGFAMGAGTNNMTALWKLPAGTTTWTKVVDTTVHITEECLALADDNIGHLVAQCQTKLLRSKP
jgi:hypothetical protein